MKARAPRGGTGVTLPGHEAHLPLPPRRGPALRPPRPGRGRSCGRLAMAGRRSGPHSLPKRRGPLRGRAAPGHRHRRRGGRGGLLLHAGHRHVRGPGRLIRSHGRGAHRRRAPRGLLPPPRLGRRPRRPARASRRASRDRGPERPPIGRRSPPSLRRARSGDRPRLSRPARLPVGDTGRGTAAGAGTRSGRGCARPARHGRPGAAPTLPGAPRHTRAGGGLVRRRAQVGPGSTRCPAAARGRSGRRGRPAGSSRSHRAAGGRRSGEPIHAIALLGAGPLGRPLRAGSPPVEGRQEGACAPRLGAPGPPCCGRCAGAGGGRGGGRASLRPGAERGHRPGARLVGDVPRSHPARAPRPHVAAGSRPDGALRRGAHRRGRQGRRRVLGPPGAAGPGRGRRSAPRPSADAVGGGRRSRRERARRHGRAGAPD